MYILDIFRISFKIKDKQQNTFLSKQQETKNKMITLRCGEIFFDFEVNYYSALCLPRRSTRFKADIVNTFCLFFSLFSTNSGKCCGIHVYLAHCLNVM